MVVVFQNMDHIWILASSDHIADPNYCFNCQISKKPDRVGIYSVFICSYFGFTQRIPVPVSADKRITVTLSSWYQRVGHQSFHS
jgi:hypothetical protein